MFSLLKAALTVLLLQLLLITTAHAEIYKWVDENGRVHFSDEKPKQQKAEQVNVEVNTWSSSAYDDFPEPLPEQKSASRKRVVMYATSWCGYCKKARNYFKEKGIPFKEYDIEKSASAKKRFDRYGGSGVPLILIGKQKMRGFSAGRFQRLYES